VRHSALLNSTLRDLYNNNNIDIIIKRLIWCVSFTAIVCLAWMKEGTSIAVYLYLPSVQKALSLVKQVLLCRVLVVSGHQLECADTHP
jgi:hypothetical protein